MMLMYIHFMFPKCLEEYLRLDSIKCLIEFGRYAKERCRKAGTKPGTFTFLGFTHYCSKSRNGRFRVKRKTSKKKFAKKCREVNLLLVKMRTCRLKEIIAKLNQILTGYYHYYRITDNTESITAFRYNIMRSLFYCLNRRRRTSGIL